MKYNKVVNWMVACSVALAMITNLRAETLDTVVKVVRIKGSARYSTGKNVWQPLQVGTTLGQGAIIQTASSSTVDVVIAEAEEKAGAPAPVATGRPISLKEYATYQPTSQHDVIRIWEDTVLAVDKLSVTQTGTDKVTDTELDLRAGRIFAAVKKVSAASTFEIKIPNGVAGIRGTLLSLSSLGVCGCAQGSVALAFKTPQGPATRMVDSGFQFDIRTGDFSHIAPIMAHDLGNLPIQVHDFQPPSSHAPPTPYPPHVSPGTGLN